MYVRKSDLFIVTGYLTACLILIADSFVKYWLIGLSTIWLGFGIYLAFKEWELDRSKNLVEQSQIKLDFARDDLLKSYFDKLNKKIDKL